MQGEGGHRWRGRGPLPGGGLPGEGPGAAPSLPRGGGGVGKAGCPPSQPAPTPPGALRNAELLSAWPFSARLFYASLQGSFSKLANR